MRNALEIVNGAISDLTAMSNQIGEVEDFAERREKAERDFGVWSRNLKAVKAEFAEVDAALKKVEHEASEKAKECERLRAEIKTKSAELNNVNTALNKIRQQLGG